MKIGILRPLLGIGGTETSLVDFAPHLARRGHDVWMHFDTGTSRSSRVFTAAGISAAASTREGARFPAGSRIGATSAAKRIRPPVS
jgi:hypothetical protein